MMADNQLTFCDPKSVGNASRCLNASVLTPNMSILDTAYDIENVMGPRQDAHAVVMTIVYMVILVTGIVGNVCTCIVIAKNRNMHTATNYYLFSLAVSDLLLLVLGLPIDVYQVWSKYPYVFGEEFCVIRGWSSETSTNASILTITAFTVERYLAICHPLRAHTMSRLSRAVKLVVVIWVIASLAAIPVAYQLGLVYELHPETGAAVVESGVCSLKHELRYALEVSTGMFFILPGTVLSVLYVLIGLQLRRSTEMGRKHDGHMHPASVNGVKAPQGTVLNAHNRQSSHRKTSVASRKDVIKMLIAVVVAFFLCWVPFHAQRLMAVYVQEPTEADFIVFNIVTNISGITYYVSATINPILYSIMSLKFRHAFLDTLKRCCGGGRRGRHRGCRGRTMSVFNSTVRSAGYEFSDFTVVTEVHPNQTSPQLHQHGTTENQNGDREVGTRVQHPVMRKGSRVEQLIAAARREEGSHVEQLISPLRREEDRNGAHLPARRKKTSSTISNSSLKMVDDDAFDDTDIADYIDQMKESH